MTTGTGPRRGNRLIITARVPHRLPPCWPRHTSLCHDPWGGSDKGYCSGSIQNTRKASAVVASTGSLLLSVALLSHIQYQKLPLRGLPLPYSPVHWPPAHPPPWRCTGLHPTDYGYGYATLQLRYATVLWPTTVATTARLPCHAQCMRHAQPRNLPYPVYTCIRDTSEGSLHLPSLSQNQASTQNPVSHFVCPFHTCGPPRA